MLIACFLVSDLTYSMNPPSVHFKWNMFDFRVCVCGKKWNHNIGKKAIDEIGWTPLLSLGQSPAECARYFASGLASICRDTCVQRLHHSIDEISFTSSYLNRLLFFLIRKLKCLTSFNYHEQQRERERKDNYVHRHTQVNQIGSFWANNATYLSNSMYINTLA